MQKKKILIIDDETEFVTMTEMRLEANGYEVISANDGPTGLEKAAAENPRLILLDVMMPGMDGFEVLRKLGKNPATQFIPVVMLTAKGEASSIFKAQERGVVDYLIKPYEPDDLIQVVRRNA